jgi:hypothetical protein
MRIKFFTNFFFEITVLFGAVQFKKSMRVLLFEKSNIFNFLHKIFSCGKVQKPCWEPTSRPGFLSVPSVCSKKMKFVLMYKHFHPGFSLGLSWVLADPPKKDSYT